MALFAARRAAAARHLRSLSAFARSPHARMHATLRARLNSCTGFRNASAAAGSRIADVFSRCSVKPSGTTNDLTVGAGAGVGADADDGVLMARTGTEKQRRSGAR